MTDERNPEDQITYYIGDNAVTKEAFFKQWEHINDLDELLIRSTSPKEIPSISETPKPPDNKKSQSPYVTTLTYSIGCVIIILGYIFLAFHLCGKI